MAGRTLFGFLALICVIAAGSCTGVRTSRTDGAPSPCTSGNASERPAIRSVTTILPVYDIAKNVGGSLVDVSNLLPPGASPHTYEPTPEDLKTVEKADIIFSIGLNLDEWMDRMAGSIPHGTDRLIRISQHIQSIPRSGRDIDPHVWMDPRLMMEMAYGVRDEYIRLMPSKKEDFQRNCDLYTQNLKKLDERYRKTLERYEKKDFVTVHSFLYYQEQRYGLKSIASISEFPGEEADPHTLITVIDTLRKQKAKTVFVEPQFSPKASETIAREIGGTVTIIDPIGSLSDPERDSYIKNMEKNLKAMAEAFIKEN